MSRAGIGPDLCWQTLGAVVLLGLRAAGSGDRFLRNRSLGFVVVHQLGPAVCGCRRRVYRIDFLVCLHIQSWPKRQSKNLEISLPPRISVRQIHGSNRVCWKDS
ncbi:hypothetical protein BZA05DRAFT_436758 [Tricharina praecox]|uniref:uncharacterized protein n=1 Tax=Tricharina praecox TaxID=43433 RepID=UPI00221F2C92|nr:uncharacterized protein BZA05DRAFT_436758 [Tricharina praecox]KAI5849922.1 hypothetical protein BZA05DRAFT_436758 [Tricharina praecox]